MYTLIKGEFSNEEAKEVIHTIFTEKMKFHEMKNFSSVERTGNEDVVAKTRITELRTELNNIKEYLDQVKENDSKLAISAQIMIHPV